MTGLTDLKQLERDAFRKFYEDGLFDVFMGLMLATMAIGAVISDWLGSEAAGTGGMLGVAIILVVVLLIARRQLLLARLGTFRPGPERRRRISSTRLALVGSVIVGLALAAAGAAAYGSEISISSFAVVMPLVWFLNAVVVMGAMAFFLDVPRFYVYGVLFGLAMPLLVWPDVVWGVDVPPLVAFGAPAAVIVGVGLRKLRRFLREYPPLGPGRERADGSR